MRSGCSGDASALPFMVPELVATGAGGGSPEQRLLRRNRRDDIELSLYLSNGSNRYLENKLKTAKRLLAQALEGA